MPTTGRVRLNDENNAPKCHRALRRPGQGEVCQRRGYRGAGRTTSGPAGRSVLLQDLAQACGFSAGAVTAVGESALAALKTRPDFAVSLRNAPVGFAEIKAPGKGADPRKFRGHDKEQWEKLQALPNLLYTDGNQFSLWRSGQLEGTILALDGDVETSGASLGAPAELLGLFDNFFRWEPIPPGSAKELARVSARLCWLLRGEVAEQLALGSPALTALATDWRNLLFPEASDTQFPDGYAQAVTFVLLMARARDIPLGPGLDQVSEQLGQTNSLRSATTRAGSVCSWEAATSKTCRPRSGPTRSRASKC